MDMPRKHYIDNLRTFCVLLLVPYHAAMAFNNWGEQNYILLGSSDILSAFVMAVAPWLMPLMFLLAGMSARLSMAKRSPGEFIAERAKRLLLPFVAGVLTVMPILAYLGDVANNGYDGGFFAHYAVFFTRFTDFTGYDGGFGIGHLWFLPTLFVIALSVLAVDLILRKFRAGKPSAWIALPLALLGFAVSPLKLASKSVAEYLIFYVIGYFFLIDSPICSRMEQSFLNRSNGITHRLASESFTFYIFHFVWVVLFEWWFSHMAIGVNFALTTVCATAATLITCESVRMLKKFVKGAQT